MTGTDLALRLDRVAAATAVQNLMGRYSHYHGTHQHPRILALCALDTPGVSQEVPFGVYEGREGVERLYVALMGGGDQHAVGSMHMNAMTTPVIEVAADGRSAKGVWMSPGHASDDRPGTFVGRWRWVRFAADFVLEHEEWKILHLKIYGLFATPYDTSWVETAIRNRDAGQPGPPPLPPELAPDRPPTSRHWLYDTTSDVDPEPLPPDPYDTLA